MKFLNLTLESPAENLALDEALLETAETNLDFPSMIRLWEAPAPMVVLGRSSPVTKEVNLEYCQANQIPVLRRASGGQTVVAGPGCLMYCLLLSYRQHPNLRMLDQAHQFVMSRIRQRLQRHGVDCQIQGICDLTINGRKVSGNSLRCKKNHLIYHGTLLYRLSPELIANCLHAPVRKPKYRGARDHREFLATLPLERSQLEQVLLSAFTATEPLDQWPRNLTKELADEKYSQQNWTYRH